MEEPLIGGGESSAEIVKATKRVEEETKQRVVIDRKSSIFGSIEFDPNLDGEIDSAFNNYRDEVAENDVVFEDKGVKVVVDPEALALIDGTEVDFVKNGLNEAFSFKNPNVTGECGCGESFNI